MKFLPSKDQLYLESRSLTFESVDSGGQKAVIFRDYELPENKFDSPRTDVLVLLPPGYPDAAPDMFFTFPWVRLKQEGRYPTAADAPFAFANITWQRWSRHSDEWRRGKDGIWTMMKRIDHALEIAK